MSVSTMPCQGTPPQGTPPLGTLGPAIRQRVVYPNYPFGLAERLGGHRGAQTSSRPNHLSFYLDAPTAHHVGRAFGRGRRFRDPKLISGSPGTTGGPKIIPFHYMPPLLVGKRISQVGWDDLPYQGEKRLRVSNPTRLRLSPRA